MSLRPAASPFDHSVHRVTASTTVTACCLTRGCIPRLTTSSIRTGIWDPRRAVRSSRDNLRSNFLNGEVSEENKKEKESPRDCSNSVERAVFPDGFSLRQFTSVMIAGRNRSVARANNGSRMVPVQDRRQEAAAIGNGHTEGRNNAQ